ncbi:Lrp/AsnC ligand binding domain-containing protein [Deinococcus sonorensis]|uniref:Lrp/AsnC ligand binding domain-containing protein n=2 Tax=Deinococcus sonorensis TaxID=309891 RepID=A0AAU7UBC9_9DEIO
MVTAIVLIQADRTQIPETASALARVKHVSEVYSVTGDWDIVAVLRMPGYEHLDDVVTAHLRRMPGILKTQTMLAFRAYSPELLDQGFGVGVSEKDR